MQFKCLFFNVFTILTTILNAQVKVGQWVDHLPYNTANAVSKLGNTVYVSNGTSMMKYNTGDNSIEKLNKYNGLSDVGIQLLRKNNSNDKLLVIYKNTNIDVIQSDGSVINFSDIKRKSIQGKKYINEVYCNGKMAYLACGFGIVAFDTDKMEIKETFYIGNGTVNYEIFQVTKNDTAFFAATQNGIFYGKSTLNLGNYQNWKPLNTGIASGPYNSIVNFNGKILASYSEKMKTGADLKDTIYQYLGYGNWSIYAPYGTQLTVKKMYDYSMYSRLLLIHQWGMLDLSADGSNDLYLGYYGFGYPNITDLYYEGNREYWLADLNVGLVSSNGPPPSPNSIISLNGPGTYQTNDLDCNDGHLYMAPTNLTDEWNNQWQYPEINTYHDEEWKRISNSYMDTIYDMNCVTVDPNDKNHAAFGSWGKGIAEYQNDVPVAVYDINNSPMKPANGTLDARVGGICFDSNSNLWVVTSLNNRFLNVKTSSGAWVNFNFSPILNANPNAILPGNPNAGKVLVDKKGFVWIQIARGSGLVVFNPGSSFSQPSPSNAKVISTAKGSGGLPTNDIYSMAEDKDGNVWIGTGTGVTVFYNTDNIFSGANWDAQQILIEQDNHVQILLENDAIRAIAVDGANRKWLGTLSSGLYCVSPDGQKEIYHFTVDNSPLYSNTIRDIAVDETTGDVFIATDFGIQSFRTDIIKGFDDFTKVHAYPNPVRPGFASPVYITGLMDESIVKITDVAGNLVWQVKSNGGQISWDMKTFNGTKVANGIYMIYCATENGEKYATAKLMIMN